MELSGHAPFIVHEDANVDKAVDMAIAAKISGKFQGDNAATTPIG